jgi:hypothetical protein
MNDSHVGPTPTAPGFMGPGPKAGPTVFGPAKVIPTIPGPVAPLVNTRPVNTIDKPANEFSMNSAIKAHGHLTEAEKRGVEIIPKLLSSYFRIIRRKVEDTVPKACVAFLIKAAKD